jgi:hypothetical protein
MSKLFEKIHHVKSKVFYIFSATFMLLEPDRDPRECGSPKPNKWAIESGSETLIYRLADFPCRYFPDSNREVHKFLCKMLVLTS